MDAKSIGATIAHLRKRMGLTQAELAERLNVSNKAVSKWENGLGYPDLSLFPLLSSLFGVSVDYLLMQKKGITVAGSIIVDILKIIEKYPTPGTLAYVTSLSQAVGGCAPNTAIDLVKIDPHLSVSVCGKVGTDENGRFILGELQKHGVNIDRIISTPTAPTSFSDVMSLPQGERTFFHVKGANACFAPEEIDVKGLNCDILHIGYLMLLDRFDCPDPEYGTAMARFLHRVQEAGIKTSIDTVSREGADYKTTVLPALPYCDYVIINELECCSIWDIPPRNEEGSLNVAGILLAMEKTAQAGVRRKVIVHAREACFLYDVKSGKTVSARSLAIPKEEMKGNTGAGDAFCAGCLYAFYNHYPDTKVLEFASAAAACNLFAANTVDGMRSKDEIYALAEKYGRLS